MLWGCAVAAVGLLWWYPDALSRFRQASGPYAEMEASCDLAKGPCEATFPDGVVVVMAASPQPAGPSDTLEITLTVKGDAEPVAVELQGVDMAMGLFRMPVVRSGQTWTASGPLPVCTTDRMQWRADVVLDDRVAGFFLWSTRT